MWRVNAVNLWSSRLKWSLKVAQLDNNHIHNKKFLLIHRKMFAKSSQSHSTRHQAAAYCQHDFTHKACRRLKSKFGQHPFQANDKRDIIGLYWGEFACDLWILHHKLPVMQNVCPCFDVTMNIFVPCRCDLPIPLNVRNIQEKWKPCVGSVILVARLFKEHKILQ